MNTINRFTGEWSVLSNFSPDEAVYEGVIYPTAEHAFAAAKTLNPNLRERIRTAGSPGLAKRWGRKVTLRSGWHSMRTDVMTEILRSKFEASEPRYTLVRTGDAFLVEGNTWHDNFWGVCFCVRCPGIGDNHLGRILMFIRDEINNS